MSDDHSLRHAIHCYLTHCEAAGLAACTIESYRLQLQWFGQAFGVREIQCVSSVDVTEYISRRRRSGRPAPSLHTEARAIRRFLNWAAERDLVSPELPIRLKVPRLPKRVIKPFTEGQVSRLLLAATKTRKPERNRAIVLLLADTGIRCGELCHLKDTDLQDNSLTVWGKGARERLVPVSPATRAALAAWQMTRGSVRGGWLFPKGSGQPLMPQGIYYLFLRLGQVAGLQGVRVSPHTMRHTVGVSWVRDGGDVFALQRLLGHSDLAMTRRYVDLASDDVAREHKQHSLVGRLG